MVEVLNTMPWPGNGEQPERLLTREWLVTNGLGGYASGSVAGVCTRRYHGLLVAALPAPAGRTVMLSHLAESLRLADGTVVRLTGEERPGSRYDLPEILTEFRLEMGLPVWRFQAGDIVVEKRVLLPAGQNTVHVNYSMVQGTGARLMLRPRMNFRAHEAPVSQPPDEGLELRACGPRYEVHSPRDTQLGPLRMIMLGQGGNLVLDGGGHAEFFYRVESARGYPDSGRVWTPGHFNADLGLGVECTFIASTEAWQTVLALGPQEALAAERNRRERLLAQAHPAVRTGMGAELVLAADQFIIVPFSRQADATRAMAEGDQARTVIAGYHWFTDWGRDTMISLEGLALATGRHAEAGYILRTFLHYVKDGLIPNMFPEGRHEGLYHTADATLWLFHAMDRYIAATGDDLTLRQALPVFEDIIAHHLRGTRFGIGVDARDGLLSQGAAGYQLTWMDAKVDGWVVTPRRGKAVELNALFYNALCLLEGWLRRYGDEGRAGEIAAHACRLRTSFNARFWNEEEGCLFDVVDVIDLDQAKGLPDAANDPAVRPNMLLAISLRHAVLDEARWRSVLQRARRDLLTPVGLRSLAPGHADYKPWYDGDLRVRDAAYHQGTVWAWLAGPFTDAWLKACPDELSQVREFVAGFAAHLGEAGLGTVSEIFDAEAPYTPRGCVSQAWSVAEVLRVLVKLDACQKVQPPKATK